MLPFFNRNKDEDLQLAGNESVVSSEDLLNETAEAGEGLIETELSIHPDWNLSKEDSYAFRFLNMECAPLQPNQVSLSGVSLIRNSETTYLITAFIRNGMDQPITLEDTALALLDEKGLLLGRKSFALQDVGEIPAHSSRPWYFQFSHDDLVITDLPATGWTLAFQLGETENRHVLELDERWEKSLAPESKKQLFTFVDRIEPPSEGEVNFLGIQAVAAENGALHVVMLVRNGTDQHLMLEQLPLHVEDASGELIAKGRFQIEDFVVRANTSKPWTFVFPKEAILKEEIDLSKWKAFTPPPKKE